VRGRRDDGATTVQYALLLALGAMVAFSSARALGIGSRDVMAAVTSALAAVGGNGGNGNGNGNSGCGIRC